MVFACIWQLKRHAKNEQRIRKPVSVLEHIVHVDEVTDHERPVGKAQLCRPTEEVSDRARKLPNGRVLNGMHGGVRGW